VKEFAVVIPAYRPEKELVDYINSLIEKNVGHVVVVDDGNDDTYSDIFDRISNIHRCTVLEHERNQGKGAGLKTAFQYVLNEHSHLRGVVTADADGQHTINDVLNIGKHLIENEDSFIIGMREFDRETTPFRSLLGNTVTSIVFRILYGKYLKDTQTGLRGFPTHELHDLIKLRGDRYEYEMNVLIYSIQKNKSIIRVDIETVYHDVHVSYFKTYSDAVRVAGSIFKGYLN
jgi:glycosyltransferase involved in cell wall biosynthesis